MMEKRSSELFHISWHLLVGGLAGKTQQQPRGRVSWWDGVGIAFGGNRVYMNKLNLQKIKI